MNKEFTRGFSTSRHHYQRDFCISIGKNFSLGVEIFCRKPLFSIEIGLVFVNLQYSIYKLPKNNG